MSGLINKVKDAIHSDKDKSHEHSEGTHGTHNSRAANAADPRIDSDRDHRANPGHTTAGGLGSTGATGTHSSGLPEGSVGPHSSRAANAADPRVDSDLDSSRRTGATGTHGMSGTTGTHGMSGTTGGMTGGSTYSENMPGHTGGLGRNEGMGTGMGRTENMPHSGTGMTGTGATTGLSGRDTSLPEGSVGPHGSRMANAADPRVDSDLDSSRRTGGLGATGNTYDQTTGTSGFASHGTGAHGPGAGTHGAGTTHQTGLGGAGAGTGYGSGPGPAPNTAGPHKSDALNKADPRVDSDLDGSKTMGKEKTFQQSDNYAGRDPTDATQVPPSILQKHVPTEIAHDNPHSDHGRRHSSTHQETHRGL